MWDWLKRWWRRPAALPAMDEITRPAPRSEGIKAGPAAGPRYAFTSFDSSTPRRSPSQGGASQGSDPGPIVGIDLGTTHAVIAVVEGRSITIIPNQDGERLTPCVVARGEDGDWLVGETARRQAVSNPDRTCRSFKRWLGSPANNWQSTLPPQQPAALVLRKLLDCAEAYLGQRPRRAVITVPACFHEGQRQAVLDAARIAGLDTEWNLTDPATGKTCRQRMRIINEPTAAALAIGSTTAWTGSRVAVLHLGGGTFDVSLIDVGDGVFVVLAIGGDAQLGGDDIDAAIVQYLLDRWSRQHPVDVGADPVAMARLLQAAEQAKIDLSSAHHAEICLPYLAATETDSLTLKTTLTRVELEELTSSLIARCKRTIERTLADARLKPSDVDEVLLVGGMTRMPCFGRLVREVFGQKPSRQLSGGDIVAAGAAIQGHQLLLGSRADVLLVDVTPLALGVRIVGGVRTLIERNTAIPTQKAWEFTIVVRQSQAKVTVCQGEAGEQALGEVLLEGLSADAEGKARIRVQFDLDKNGILDVQVCSLADNRTFNARMFPSGGLSSAEVERLHREAEQERLYRRWQQR